jgi:uncharacterized protein YceH (UPF0502 family)
MVLNGIELRILGSLIEKERTTPDAYPLTTGALVSACNQRTNRDPVSDYHQQEVREALQRLRHRGLMVTVQEVSDRVPKHRHKLAEAWDLSPGELALLAVLMLRGPQTAAEVRARSERYGDIPSLAMVEQLLTALGGREHPLVRNLGRAPGQAQDRWAHALSEDEERFTPRVRRPEGASATANGDLEARLAALEARVTALEAALAAGEDDDPGALG